MPSYTIMAGKRLFDYMLITVLGRGHGGRVEHQDEYIIWSWPHDPARGDSRDHKVSLDGALRRVWPTLTPTTHATKIYVR